jgi:fucose 4-O-acetylase-like acetyltransferase
MMITAVVVTHLTITYSGTPVEWYYMEIGKTVPLMDFLVLFLGLIGVGFAMGLFFFIAGYFSPAAYDRKGAGQFLIDRLKRLGIPWLICELALVPVLNYIVDIHGKTNCAGGFYNCNYQGSFLKYLALYPANQGSISDGPDWFLEALLIFSLVYLLWRMATRSVTVGAFDGADRTSTVPDNWQIALFALVIGVSTFVVRFWLPVFTYFPPWNLEFAHFPQYIALFAAGAWAYRRDLLTTFTDQQGRLWRWVALICVLVLPAILLWVGALTGASDPRVAGGVTWMSLVYSLWEGFLCVSMAITFLTWYRRSFSHQSRIGHAMSESAFAVYILHPAVIVPLTLALSGIQMNRSFKFLLIAPIAVGLTYLIMHLVRKVPVFRIVFG